MGESQAITTRRWGITRRTRTPWRWRPTRTWHAWDAGFFDDLVTPFGREQGQCARTDTTAEKLASLKPVFGTDQRAPR